MARFKGIKQRRLCNRCQRRTTLKKVFRPNGEVVVKCNSCGGEHVLRRAKRKFLNKRGALGYILIFLFLISVVVGAFLFFRIGKKGIDEGSYDVNRTVYPLRFRSLADADVTYNLYETVFLGESSDEKITFKNITSKYRDAVVNKDDDTVLVFLYDRIIFFSKGEGKYYEGIVFKRDRLVDTGYLRPGVIESFQKTKFNSTYLLSVVGPKHYFMEVVCYQDDVDDVCVVNPERIADIEISYVDRILFLSADNGYLRDALLCLAWMGDIISVEVPGLNKSVIPERLFNFVDRCYCLDDVRGRFEWPIIINGGVRGDNLTFYLIDKARMSDGELGYDEDSGFPDLVYEVQA